VNNSRDLPQASKPDTEIKSSREGNGNTYISKVPKPEVLAVLNVLSQNK
jgi:hypothetical protein